MGAGTACIDAASGTPLRQKRAGQLAHGGVVP